MIFNWIKKYSVVGRGGYGSRGCGPIRGGCGSRVVGEGSKGI